MIATPNSLAIGGISPISGREGFMSGIMSPSSQSNNNTTANDDNNYHDRRHLIRPSNASPWSVDIVCAVPRVASIIEHLNDYTTGATCSSTSTAGWTCLGLPNGQFHLWQNSTTTSTNTTTTGAAAATSAESSMTMEHHPPFLVDPPKHVLSLYHPDPSYVSQAGTRMPLISLTPSPDNEYVFCYIAYPMTGNLVLWKVSRKELLLHGMTANNIPTRTPAPMEDDNNNSQQQQQPFSSLPFTAFAHLELDPEEYLTSLQVEGRHTILLGTSEGNIFWCTQTTVPIGLHVQKIPRPTISSGSSWSIRQFFGGSSGAGGPSEGSSEDRSPILHFQLFLNNTMNNNYATTTPSSFISISEEGTMLLWNVVSPTATVSSHHHATFETHFLLSVLSSFREHHEKEDDPTVIKEVQVLRVAMNTTNIHMILRVTTTTSDVTSRNAESTSKLYWVRFHYDANTNKLQWMDSHWLNRFALSEDNNIQVRGLIITDNNFAYATFHHIRSSTVIVMALKDTPVGSTNTTTPTLMNEVDLPNSTIPGLLPNTLTKDVVTHGCTVLSTSGLGIRIRVMDNYINEQQQQQQQAPRGWIPGTRQLSKKSNPSTVHTLTNHLRTTFWESYKHGNATIRIPPSLTGANIQDLEAAIVALGRQLQQTGGGSSSLILLEWHHSLVHLLQQSGLYRSLSVQCKWHLLALGQEAAVFLQLAQEAFPQSSTSPKKRRRTHGEWGQQHLAELKSFNVANWLQQVFQDVLQGIDGGIIGGSTDDEDSAGAGTATNVIGHPAYETWCAWLCSTLEVAMTYRQERGSFMYDINIEHAPSVVDAVIPDQENVVPVWTSHPVLQDILFKQLQYWKKNVSTAKDRSMQVQIVVNAALQSFSDTVDSLNTKLSQERYHEIKTIAIPLLRAIGGDDRKQDYLAFTLSVKHKYFEGICELALDHEKKSDRKQFLLGPLFASFSSTSVNLDSNNKSKKSMNLQSFGQFVLQWHCDRKLYGHAIKYGRYCPDDLNYWLQHDERLRPYQWIQSAHVGDFDAAAKSLFANSNAHDATLSDAKWALCMAKISNHIILSEQQGSSGNSNSIQARHVQIENKLELAKAQEMLLSPQSNEKSSDRHMKETASVLWPAGQLFDLAMEKANQENISKDDVLKYCLIGLAICSTFSTSDPTQCKHCAAQVWAKSVANDATLWSDWMRNDVFARIGGGGGGSYFKDLVMKETIFGLLLQECIKDNRLSKVKYGPLVEKEVLKHLSLLGGDIKVDIMRQILSTTAIGV